MCAYEIEDMKYRSEVIRKETSQYGGLTLKKKYSNEAHFQLIMSNKGSFINDVTQIGEGVGL